MTDKVLRQILVLANAFKEGDLALGGTRDDDVRADARRALGGEALGEIRRSVLVGGGVAAALDRSRDGRCDPDLDALAVERLKAVLIGPGAASLVRQYRHARPS